MYNYDFLVEKDVNSVITQLKKYGIAVVPGYLVKSQLDNLNKEFEASLSQQFESISIQEKHPTNVDGRVARINTTHANANIDFPEAYSVFNDEFMQNVANNYFSPFSIDFNSAIYVTHEYPCKTQILPWHHDRIQMLKFWFYLKDTTKNDGAFEYCPCSQWEGRYRAAYYLSQGYGVKDIPNDIDENLINNPVTIELNAGDLLIFDPDGFHRGGVVGENGERRVMRAHTYPKEGRRYGDKMFSPGWWLRSPFNINRWLKRGSSRLIGDKIKDNTINRHKHSIK